MNAPAAKNLSQADKALLELMSRLDLTEEEKIKQLKFLCQECGANINAKEQHSVLWKAIEADSPALVTAVLELGADVHQKPCQGVRHGVLHLAATLFFKVNTPRIVEVLCLAGANISEIWKERIFPPHVKTQIPSYYDTIKTLLRYSDFKSTFFNDPLEIFICFGRFYLFAQIIEFFEIIKIFMEKGANLFAKNVNLFDKDNIQNSNHPIVHLIMSVNHEKGAFVHLSDLLNQIPSIKQRLEAMSLFSAISKGIASGKGDYYHSPNILKFKQMLDDQILAIKQIRTVSRLLAQGFPQEESTLYALNRDVLLNIAARSIQKPEALPERVSEKIAQTFFARPPSPYTDGCSPLPLALR